MVLADGDRALRRVTALAESSKASNLDVLGIPVTVH
jgi:hypothetical protein